MGVAGAQKLEHGHQPLKQVVADQGAEAFGLGGQRVASSLLSDLRVDVIQELEVTAIHLVQCGDFACSSFQLIKCGYIK